ncbi:MAG TPA: hypothetical protein VF074_10945, partial [Pyrinomonadaceae bacterium]
LTQETNSKSEISNPKSFLTGESVDRTDWLPAETSTHQDHVIAHVLGATVIGYFVHDETAFLLLDIGFIWNIYLDGEMGLLPHPVATGELEADEALKEELKSDVDRAFKDPNSPSFIRLQPSPDLSPIQSVDFFVRENSRQLVLTCMLGSVVVETSLDTREVTIMGADAKQSAESASNELSEVARDEQEFVRQTLEQKLGREPTEEEVNEWLREHTESY